MGPVSHFNQRLPEGLIGEFCTNHIGTGNNQRIQPLRLDLLKAFIVLINVRPGFLTSGKLTQGKRMHIKLRNGIALTNQSEKLSFGCGQRRIRHHIQ